MVPALEYPGPSMSLALGQGCIVPALEYLLAVALISESMIFSQPHYGLPGIVSSIPQSLGIS